VIMLNMTVELPRIIHDTNGLPFHLVMQIDWFAAIVVGLVSFILLGVEQIGNEIENPFGHDANDLPLDEICQNIITNVEQTIAYQST
jgi:putative membrane protein